MRTGRWWALALAAGLQRARGGALSLAFALRATAGRSRLGGVRGALAFAQAGPTTVPATATAARARIARTASPMPVGGPSAVTAGVASVVPVT